MDTHPVVFLLDDDETIVLALSRMLRADGFTVRAWTSALDFLESHNPETPGCLVADVLMPAINGLDLQQLLRLRDCMRPIVFITGCADMPTAVQAMKAGAVSCLEKPVRRSDLVAAVREAIDLDAAAREHRREQRAILARLESLTPRERQVLTLVADGMLNKQIAAQLGASEKTIKVHRGRLMEKMQVRSAAALVNLLTRVDGKTQRVSTPVPRQVSDDARL
ncbi:MAG: response regulator [Gammaproteobacteria bacterium]